MSLSGIEAKARRNFQNAVVALQEAVPKETRTSLEQIKVTEFNNTSSIDSAAAEIDEMMEQIVSGMEKQRLGGSRTHRVKENLKRYFQSSFHFAQIFLMVAKDASAVSKPKCLSHRLMELGPGAQSLRRCLFGAVDIIECMAPILVVAIDFH
jgi:hypothetical protein